MSQIIALISAKGGAGKTSIAVNLAHACAVAGLKVLVIDCDINTNGATAFYRQKEDVRSQLNNCITFQEILYNVLYPEIYKIDTEKIPVVVEENLEFIPGGKYLVYGGADNEDKKEQYEKLKTKLAEYIAGWVENYDILIMDQGAGYNSLIEMMLSFATEILIVREPDRISLGLAQDLFERVRKTSKHIISCVNKIPAEKYNSIKDSSEEDILVKCIGFKYDYDFTRQTEEGENIEPMPVSWESGKWKKGNESALSRIALTVFKEYKNIINDYLQNIEDEQKQREQREQEERERIEQERMEQGKIEAKRFLKLCGIAVLGGVLSGIIFYYIQAATLKLTTGIAITLSILIGIIMMALSGIPAMIQLKKIPYDEFDDEFE